jgi:hypothetical protein
MHDARMPRTLMLNFHEVLLFIRDIELFPKRYNGKDANIGIPMLAFLHVICKSLEVTTNKKQCLAASLVYSQSR